MDNCTIEDNSVVNKSILGTSVTLKENSNVLLISIQVLFRLKIQ